VWSRSHGIVAASGAPSSGMQQFLMLAVRKPVRKLRSRTRNPAIFTSGTQALYGVWDWKSQRHRWRPPRPRSGQPRWLERPLQRAVREPDPHKHGACLAHKLTLRTCKPDGDHRRHDAEPRHREQRDGLLGDPVDLLGNKQFGWYIICPAPRSRSFTARHSCRRR